MRVLASHNAPVGSDSRRWTDVTTGIGLFALVSVPSLKLLFLSVALNALPVTMFALSALGTYRFHHARHRAIHALIWTAFSAAFLFAMTLSPPSSFDAMRYIYVIGMVLLVLLLATPESMRIAIRLAVIWGTFIALWQLTLGVPTNWDVGQHYLTIGMPIGAALSVTLSFALLLEGRFWRKILYLLLSALYLTTLATLHSRTALLGPLVVVSLFVGGAVIINRNWSVGRRIVSLVSVSALVGLVTTVILMTPYFRQAARVARALGGIENEPRYRIYVRAVDLLRDSPLVGYGVGRGSSYFSSYPHNIFLEVGIFGGALLLLLFFIVLVPFFAALIKMLRTAGADSLLLGGAALSLFLLIQWNISFSFLGAEIPLGAVAMFAISAAILKSAHRHPAPNTQ